MITFYKYHGAGNDFIMIDNRSGSFDVHDTDAIQLLCHRHFGIGADGILLVENSEEYDFSMVYINSDGSMGAMCGNGGRCIVHFAHYVLGLVKNPKHVRFMAVDGLHEAEILGDDQIKLKMQDVGDIGERNGYIFLYSGTTPHNVMFVENLSELDVPRIGKEFQKLEKDPKGMNVNYVEEERPEENEKVASSRSDAPTPTFHVRTYERGVWDETFACGTGATSVAIACSCLGKLQGNICHISMLGGDLTIEFEKTENGAYQNIWLTGPAKFVYKGEII
jgi:diaminopimelate epimerase